MTRKTDCMAFPSPLCEERLPLFPAPGAMPHSMLHEKGSIETALFGNIGDAFDAILERIATRDLDPYSAVDAILGRALRPGPGGASGGAS